MRTVVFRVTIGGEAFLRRIIRQRPRFSARKFALRCQLRNILSNKAASFHTFKMAYNNCELTWDLLTKQNAATSSAIIKALDGDELFEIASKAQAASIRQRDQEDDEKIGKRDTVCNR